MVSDRFGMLLEEMGKVLEIPDLHPDSNNSCLIKFKDGLQIQFELDRQSGEFLIIGTDFGEVAAGKYRENIFLEALKANGRPLPRNGTLAFSVQANHLIMFEMLPINELRGSAVAEFLVPFSAKARIWKEAVERGVMPAIAAEYGVPAPPGGVFGLKMK